MVSKIPGRFSDSGRIGWELVAGILEGVIIAGVVGAVMLYGYNQVIGTKVDALVKNTDAISAKLDAVCIQMTAHVSAQAIREMMIDKELEKDGLRRARNR